MPYTTLLEQEGRHRDKTMKQDHSKPSPEVQSSQPKELQEEPWDIWSCSHQLDCTGQLEQCGQGSGIKNYCQWNKTPLEESRKSTKRSQSTSEEALEEVLGIS